MYWWLNAPVFATSTLFTVILIALWLLAPTRMRIRAVGIAMIAGVLLYVPACAVVMAAMDRQRFGYFDYPSVAEMPNKRWRRFLPETASDIRIHQHRGGCIPARYRIRPADLQQHLDALWSRFGAQAFNTRVSATQVATPAELAIFSGLGLPESASETGLLRYSGPMKQGGYGATFYADPGSDLVFQQGCSW